MTNQPLPDHTPATELFPQFQRDLLLMVSREVAGLTDEQLDWQSDQWEWSQWSTRRQVSHMAAFVQSWLLRRWGEQLFPQGTAYLGPLGEFSPAPPGPWLEESKFWTLPDLLEQVQVSMRLAQHVLEGETVGSMRTKEVSAPGTSDFWELATPAHSTGLRPDPANDGYMLLTLEATFRHLYYEFTTHMYNIQRLKRAQGLTAIVEVPAEGYWVLPQWDKSEA